MRFQKNINTVWWSFFWHGQSWLTQPPLGFLCPGFFLPLAQPVPSDIVWVTWPSRGWPRGIICWLSIQYLQHKVTKGNPDSLAQGFFLKSYCTNNTGWHAEVCKKTFSKSPKGESGHGGWWHEPPPASCVTHSFLKLPLLSGDSLDIHTFHSVLSVSLTMSHKL